MVDFGIIPPKQIKKGKVIGKTSGRYIIQINPALQTEANPSRGSILAYSDQVYGVGDAVLIALVNNSFQVISKHRAMPKNMTEVYIDG